MACAEFLSNMPKSTLNIACTKFQSNMPEWLVQQFCHRASVKHARVACTKFLQNTPKSTLNMACTKFQSNIPERLRLAQAATAAHVYSHAASAPLEPTQVSKVPHLPRKVQVDVAKRHACHAHATSMSPSATPAKVSRRRRRPTATNGDQARHRSQPSVISAAPATQGAARCQHACHAKCR